MLKWIPSVLLVVFATFDLNAQSSIIESFTAIQKGDEVFLKWKIGKGNSCIDMEIQRGTDNDRFNMLGTIEGLCGSDDSDSWYDWTDDGPFADGQQYEYRIWASNGTVISEVRTVSYNLSPAPLQVLYQTGINSVQVLLNTEQGGTNVLSLFNLSGQLIREWTGLGSYANLEIASPGMASGIYMLQLRNDSGFIDAVKISF